MVVIAYDEHHQPQALGSAFAVDDGGVVATNFHVIEGASSVEVKRAGEEQTSSIDGLYAVKPEHDLALLKVPYKLRPLELGGARPTVGERIVAIGNPRGLESTLSEGIISGIRQLEGEFELYQISAPISPGSSGGPVLDTEARVVGVASATIQGGQNLNFAVPSSAVDNLNKSRGVLAPLDNISLAPEQAQRAWGQREDEGLVRVVDASLKRSWESQRGRRDLTGSLYNGTQYRIHNVQLRLICYREGLEVPIDYQERELFTETSGWSDPIPPGLAKPIQFLSCTKRATDFELRILGYEVVR